MPREAVAVFVICGLPEWVCGLVRGNRPDGPAAWMLDCARLRLPRVARRRARGDSARAPVFGAHLRRDSERRCGQPFRFCNRLQA